MRPELTLFQYQTITKHHKSPLSASINTCPASKLTVHAMSGNNTNDCTEECQLSTREKYEKWFSGVVKQDEELAKSPAADPDKTDEEDPDKTDDEDPDKTDDEELSEQDTAVIHQYKFDSDEGKLFLQVIRDYFNMDRSTPFANVCAFLERNGDVIRHLHSETVPNPNHYVASAGEGDALHEPVRTVARARTARDILDNIRSIDWESRTIGGYLDVVTNRGAADDILYPQVMLKQRASHRTERAIDWLCENDPEWRDKYEAQRTAERAKHRLGKRRSSLRNEVRFHECANKRGADDAAVRNDAKRLRG